MDGSNWNDQLNVFLNKGREELFIVGEFVLNPNFVFCEY